MDSFELNAPQFLELGQHITVDDDADKIFDNAIISVTTPTSSRPSSAMDISSSWSDKENQASCVDDGKEKEIAESTGVEVLRKAVKNLWRASGSRSSIPKKKDTPEPEKLRMQTKRQGSPMVEQQPKKYISLAEAVHLFHSQTPQRFHSRLHDDKHNQSLPNAKSVWHKYRTKPKSPHLITRNRARPVQHLSREQEEKKLAEEMKMHQLKARPLNPQILAPPKLGMRVESKPCTVQVPFNLTAVPKKKVVLTSASPPLYVFSARPVPKKLLKSTCGVPEKEERQLTNPVSPMCLKRSKVYGTSMTVKDGKMCVTEKELHNFGIPTVESERKRSTETQPFSFDERDKELIRRKAERLQKLLEEEKKSREFHAKPVPASVINSPALSANSLQLSGSATKPVPFDLEVEKRVQPRLEQFKQKVMEEEKILEQMTHFKARPATVIQKKPFEPRKSDRPLTDVTAVELNTEKRAKERQVFDLKVKLEQEKLEELRKLREEGRRVKEKEEVALLRKETVHKANPVRHYKKFEIQKSDKLLTDPLTPTFLNRNK